jgi:RNA-directed DNA polymerase
MARQRQGVRHDGNRGVGSSDSTEEARQLSWREADDSLTKRLGETVPALRGGTSLSTEPNRLSELARRRPRVKFTSLAHLLTVERLLAAYRRLNPSSCAGVDGQTLKKYGQNLGGNLRDLQRRIQEGTYRATPVKRIYIEKEDGKKRPIGIPILEDKIAQAAVVSILEPIYEEDFFDLSYGFRPKRSQHQALAAVLNPLKDGRVRWQLDIDLSGYFDSINHNWLMKILGHRIADKTILKLIGKWLKAGVWEDGNITRTTESTPQGGVLSPLLANIFLHYAFDWWAETEMRKHLEEMYIARYADDITVGFQNRKDADLFMRMARERFEKFGLKMNLKKTKLVETGRQASFYARREGRKLGTFDFLGFTHVSIRTKQGRYRLTRLTAHKRMNRFIKGINEWCRYNRHLPLKEQWRTLCSKLRGHFLYYGYRENHRRLDTVRWKAQRSWRRWLARRGGNGMLSWKKFEKVLAKYPLPRPNDYCRSIA